MIDGNVTLSGPVRIERGSVIKAGAVLAGPCYIGRNCYVGNNVLVRSYSSLGAGLVDRVRRGAEELRPLRQRAHRAPLVRR